MNDLHARVVAEMRIKQHSRIVGRAVVHNDHVHRRIVGRQNGSYRLYDYAFLIVRGNQHGYAGQRVRRFVVIAAKFFDQREYPDHQRASAYQHNSQHKHIADPECEPVVERENKTVSPCFKPFPPGKRNHYFRARLVHQFRHRNKFVSTRAQLIDDLRQCRHGLAAVSTAIVEQNDVAGVGLAEYSVDNFLGRHLFAVRLSPIVRIDFLSDDQIAHVLYSGQLRYFFRVFRLVVNSIRRPEENRFRAERALNQALRNIQFPSQLRRRNFVQHRMRVSVISNRMAVRIFAFENSGRFRRFLPDHKKGRRHMLLFEHIENFRCPARIGAVVEGDGNLFVRCAQLIDLIGKRVALIGL